VTDGKFFFAQIMFLSYKKSQNMKISKKKILFFSTVNQSFPHIPYVASKKATTIAKNVREKLEGKSISKLSCLFII
jgi:hypothetical protein